MVDVVDVARLTPVLCVDVTGLYVRPDQDLAWSLNQLRLLSVWTFEPLLEPGGAVQSAVVQQGFVSFWLRFNPFDGWTRGKDPGTGQAQRLHAAGHGNECKGSFRSRTRIIEWYAPNTTPKRIMSSIGPSL